MPDTDVLEDIGTKLRTLEVMGDTVSGWLLEKCRDEIVRLRGLSNSLDTEMHAKPMQIHACPECGKSGTEDQADWPDGYFTCLGGHTNRFRDAVMVERQDCTVKVDVQRLMVFNPSKAK